MKTTYVPFQTATNGIAIPLEKEAESVLHFHRGFELDYILEPGVVAVVDGREIQLEPHDVLFVSEVSAHSLTCDDPARMYISILPHPSLCLDFADSFKVKTLPNRLSDKLFNRELLLSLFTDLTKENTRLIERGLIDVLFGRIISAYPMTIRKRDKKLDLAMNIFTYIEEHCSEDLTLTSLSEQFEFSKEYFSRLFNSCAGRNLNQFINRARLEKFVRLARERQNLSVGELSSLCGFQSAATFYRTFKETFGTAPSAVLRED